MTRGYDKDLYILAFDHRGSFRKKLGVGSRAEYQLVPLFSFWVSPRSAAVWITSLDSERLSRLPTA